eukprot:GILI01015170.1.p1 GENE.GILI01015170.1~~GILI01015170.1.p1  ORF type:complete len:310 (+),score=34.22 GILI01015170.1:394-1323(+)
MSNTPMHIAVFCNEHMPSLIALLAANANPNIPNKWGKTPFQQAVQCGFIEAASCLASLPGAPLNAADGDGWAPLHHADGDVLRMLLSKNADIDVKGRDDRRPIHEAVCRIDANTVNILLKHGCAVSSDAVTTALHDAANTGIVEHVAKLLDNGSDVNEVTGKDGMSPLHCAARGIKSEFRTSVSYQKTIWLLAAEGANLEATNASGCTPLHLSVEQHSGSCLNHLISLGANVNAINKEGQTPLHIAAAKMRIDTVEALAQQGCNVRVWDNNGNSALDLFEAAVRALESGDSFSKPLLSVVVNRVRLLLG